MIRVPHVPTTGPPARAWSGLGVWAGAAAGAAAFFFLPDAHAALRWGAAGAAGVFVYLWADDWVRGRALRLYRLLLDALFAVCAFAVFGGIALVRDPATGIGDDLLWPLTFAVAAAGLAVLLLGHRALKRRLKPRDADEREGAARRQ